MKRRKIATSDFSYLYRKMKTKYCFASLLYNRPIELSDMYVVYVTREPIQDLSLSQKLEDTFVPWIRLDLKSLIPLKGNKYLLSCELNRTL